MKVSSDYNGFKPVTITIESKEELDCLYSIIAKAESGLASDTPWKLYKGLQAAGAENLEYVGHVALKKEF